MVRYEVMQQYDKDSSRQRNVQPTSRARTSIVVQTSWSQSSALYNLRIVSNRGQQHLIPFVHVRYIDRWLRLNATAFVKIIHVDCPNHGRKQTDISQLFGLKGKFIYGILIAPSIYKANGNNNRTCAVQRQVTIHKNVMSIIRKTRHDYLFLQVCVKRMPLRVMWPLTWRLCSRAVARAGRRPT